MIGGSNGNYIGLLSLLSFGFSVIAAVMAIDMYRLLRTGELGKSWRILIISSVMFALMQALRMAEFLEWKMFQVLGLSQIVELMFVITLAYAFFLQRHAFNQAAGLRKSSKEMRETEVEPDVIEAHDDSSRDEQWARLNGYATDEDNVSTDDVEWSRKAPKGSPPSRSAIKPGS